MKRTRSVPNTRWLAVAFAALMVAASFFLAPSTAYAAGCYRTGCNGKDPNAQGCTGQTLTSKQFLSPEARIDLRYSSVCDANWARLVYSGPFNCCVQFILREEVQRWNGSAWVYYQHRDKTFTYGATQSNIWTLMTANETNDRHRACVIGEVCTSWVS